MIFKILTRVKYFDHVWWDADNRKVWALIEAWKFVWELTQHQIWMFYTKIELGTKFQPLTTYRKFSPYMVKETENREVWALLEARQFVWELSQYEIWISHTNIESSTKSLAQTKFFFIWSCPICPSPCQQIARKNPIWELKEFQKSDQFSVKTSSFLWCISVLESLQLRQVRIPLTG